MRKKREAAETTGARCPACEAPLNVASVKTNQKVQCPRCRATVQPLKIVEDGAEPGPVNHPEMELQLQRQEERIRQLEARVAELEKLLTAAPAPITSIEPEPKIRWVPGAHLPEYSPAQADALGRNLRAIRSQAITVQFPTGDIAAKERAKWFTDVFALANWQVHGPVDLGERTTGASGLALVTSLPVSPESAATFLAIRAAGFPVSTIYDADRRAQRDRLIVA